MSYHYRCQATRQGCYKRRTLSKPIEEYKSRPICLSCGKNLYAIKDVRARGKRFKCGCGAYSFPHKHCKWCDDVAHLLSYEDRLYREVQEHGFSYISNWDCYIGVCNGWW